MNRELWKRLLVLAGATMIVLSACGGGSSGDAEPAADDTGTPADDVDENAIFLEPAGSLGPDPFLVEAVSIRPDPAIALPVDASIEAPTDVGTPVTTGGGQPGLYGGSGDALICDQDQMIEFLTVNADKARAFVAAFNADPTFSFNGGQLSEAQIGDYINSLVPVVLTADTRVTNHGFKNGQPTARQAIVQKGTAVLVDQFGVPRVKCLCGNPLLPPKDTGGKVVGPPWPDYDPNTTVTVNPNPDPLPSIPAIDINTGQPIPLTPPNTPTPPPATTPCTIPDPTGGSVTANPGEEITLGNDTGAVARVNDDCSTTVVNCYYPDGSGTGTLSTAAPGATVDISGTSYTFGPDCSLGTAPTTAPSTCAVVDIAGTRDVAPGTEVQLLGALGGAVGDVVRVNDDCSTTLLRCWYSDAQGLPVETPTGSSFSYAGDNYTFDAICVPTLDTAAPPTSCSIPDPTGGTVPAAPGDQIPLGNDTGAVVQVNADCSTTIVNCYYPDGTGTGGSLTAAPGDTVTFNGSSFTFGSDCSFNAAAPAAAPNPPSVTYCSPTGQADPVDLTIINNTATTLYLWWHDFNCTPEAFGSLAPGQQLSQGTSVGHFWSLNTDTGAEIGTHAPTRPPTSTFCADNTSPC